MKRGIAQLLMLCGLLASCGPATPKEVSDMRKWADDWRNQCEAVRRKHPGDDMQFGDGAETCQEASMAQSETQKAERSLQAASRATL